MTYTDWAKSTRNFWTHVETNDTSTGKGTQFSTCVGHEGPRAWTVKVPHRFYPGPEKWIQGYVPDLCDGFDQRLQLQNSLVSGGVQFYKHLC